MLKLRLLLYIACIGNVGLSQTMYPFVSADTTGKDSFLLREVEQVVLDNVPIISLDENDVSDGDSKQNVSSILTAARDPFYSAAAFNFSVLRFRIRGYDGELFNTYINGIPLNNLDNGITPWSLWGGLNDVMRNRDASFGLRHNTFSFGDIGGNTNIDTRISKQRKQTSYGYALSNRNYFHRLSFSHNTGLNKKGWAFALAGGRRWAGEGYVSGTFYNSWSYFIGIDKYIGTRHLLSLAVFGAPTQNGRQGAATEESIDLAGDKYYNPYWGYQNGEKRNANVSHVHQPFIILSHDYKVNNHTSLVTGISYSMGTKSTTALDWYNAPDPRPDYYRYLPSYQSDLNQKEQLAQLMRVDENLRQINWNRLYDVNRVALETVPNANGIMGNDITGRRSHYIVEERVIASNRFGLNTVLNKRLNDYMDYTAGASYQQQKNNYHKKVNDLLGGEFYVDINQFAERDFPTDPNASQNDVNRPNRILKQDDKFGYDYNINISIASLWNQVVLKFNRIDLFVAGEVSYTQFYRKGNVRNGLFPSNSFGQSTRYTFTNYGVKAGVTYKLNGRNYLYINGAYITKAPFAENVYLSPRTRDAVQTNLISEKLSSLEGGYILNSPKLKLRATGYYTKIDNQMNVISFYHDDFKNLVNYALSNIDKLHYGGEFGAEVKIAPSLTLNAVAAIGRYYYNSRQQAVITLDNNATELEKEQIYAQNFRVSSTPQEAYSIGFNYRSPDFWFVSITGNYFRQMWLEFNPIRRTYKAVEGLEPKSEEWNAIIHQTAWKPQFTLDFFAGYSLKLPKSLGLKKPTFLALNTGINNLLNNQNMITGGFEQLRFDFENKNSNKFPPKVYYGYGLNYFISIAIRF